MIPNTRCKNLLYTITPPGNRKSCAQQLRWPPRRARKGEKKRERERERGRVSCAIAGSRTIPRDPWRPALCALRGASWWLRDPISPVDEKRASDSYASHGNRGSLWDNHRLGGGWKPSAAFLRGPRVRPRTTTSSSRRRRSRRPSTPLPPPIVLPTSASLRSLDEQHIRGWSQLDSTELLRAAVAAVRQRPRRTTRYASRPRRQLCQLFQPLRLVDRIDVVVSRCSTFADPSRHQLSILKLSVPWTTSSFIRPPKRIERFLARDDEFSRRIRGVRDVENAQRLFWWAVSFHG